MKVKCPKCEAIYQIADSKIPNGGIYGRCPKCNERFFIKKTNEESPQPPKAERVIKEDVEIGNKKEPDKKRVISIPAKIFSVLIAIIMGLMSGLLIYFGTLLIFFSPGDKPSSWFVFITFMGGWGLSTFIMLHKAKSISKVFSRGFLIGAAEWFAMIPVSMIVSGKAAVQGASKLGDPASTAGAMIGGGLIGFIGTGFSLAMMIVCLFGFLISFLIGREMKPEKS